jgi:DNA-binding NarL/FixJ family response regulator
LNIAIITSNDVYGESLKTVLNQIPRFKVTLVCRNWNDAATQIARKTVDIVLLDSAVCKDDPGRFVKQIQMLSPKTKILMLLDHMEECWYTQAIKSGADDAIPQYADKKILEEHICMLTHIQEHTTARRKNIK